MASWFLYCLWLLQRYKLQGRAEWLPQGRKAKARTPGPSLSQPAHPARKDLHLILTLLPASFHSLPPSLCTSHGGFLAVSRGTRQADPLKPCPGGSLVGLLCGRQPCGLLIQLRQDLPEPDFISNGNPPCLKKPSYCPAFPTSYLSPYH